MSAYKAMKTDFFMPSLTYIFQEGIGVNGSYVLRGSISVQDREVHVIGRAGISLLMARKDIQPNIDAYMTAALSKITGEKIITRRLSDEHGSIIPSEWLGPMDIFIGAADLVLPLPPEPLVLEISGNVHYGFTEGSYVANPVFPPTKTFAIEVEA